MIMLSEGDRLVGRAGYAIPKSFKCVRAIYSFLLVHNNIYLKNYSMVDGKVIDCWKQTEKEYRVERKKRHLKVGLSVHLARVGLFVRKILRFT